MGANVSIIGPAKKTSDGDSNGNVLQTTATKHYDTAQKSNSKVSLIHLSFPSPEVFPVDLGELFKPAGRLGESRELLLFHSTQQQQREDIQEVIEGEP